MKLLKDIKIHPRARQVLMVTAFVGVGLGLVSAVGEKMNSQVTGMEIDVAVTEFSHSMISVKDMAEYVTSSMPELKEGSMLKTLDLRKLENILEEHPQVRNADVYLNTKNIIEVKIYQKEPIFRLFGIGKESFYLDNYGGEIPLSTHYTARIPVVVVEDFAMNSEELYRELIELKRELSKNLFVETLVDQVIIGDGGTITLVPLLGDFKIKIGTTKDLEGKFERLERLYKEKLIHKGWGYYKTIDLRFNGQVVAQKKVIS